jgi:hypothetical protein
MKKISVLTLVLSLVLAPRISLADNPEREFLMSCTYGVLAGTLVGAASLAFTDKPGDNLNKVARGASLGLYAGILLGLYVVYVVPGQESDDYDGLEKTSGLMVYPMISEKGVDGAAFDWTITRF